MKLMEPIAAAAALELISRWSAVEGAAPTPRIHVQQFKSWPPPFPDACRTATTTNHSQHQPTTTIYSHIAYSRIRAATAATADI